jgi:secreted trypsin-like serine protease
VTPEADRAHYFARNTFDYFDANHGHNSINGAGMQVISSVLFTPDGSSYANAFWSGTQMVYGNNGLLTTDDIVGHELTHGVTQFTSNLLYFYESGAINEALSDIFGEFIDLTNGINSFGGADLAGDRWELGEDSSLGTIRHMQNPPLYNDPDRTRSGLYFTGVSSLWNRNNDHGGVHTNSGVANKAAYLMADGGTFNSYTISALGIPKTSAIFYYVNSMLLTSGSDYNVLYESINQACQNLIGQVGITSTDCDEANEAALATEMHLTPVNDTFAPSAPFCPDGQEPNDLFYDSFENGTGNFTIEAPLGGLGATSWRDTEGAWGEAYATTGDKSIFGINNISQFQGQTGQTTDSRLAMNSNVLLPANAYLHFSHYYAWESGSWDGGVLEYSTNGGGTWLDASGFFNAGQNYDGVLIGPHPLQGRSAFSTFTRGFVSSKYDLSSLAGQNIRFRWRIGADNVVTLDGWIVDDIRIYTCAPTVTYAPPDTPLLTNYNFSSGETDWNFWGSIVHQAPAGELQIYRTAPGEPFGEGLLDEEIIGGSEVDPPGSYPWQVALVSSGAGSYWSRQFCGGSLIQTNWVLTAAHCVDGGTLPSSLNIVAGIHDLTSPAGSQELTVSQIIIHENYSFPDYDIALLKLNGNVTLGGSGASKTALIPMVPSHAGSLTGITATVSGWGNINPSGSQTFPNELYSVDVPIISNAVCNDPQHLDGLVTDRMVCAGVDQGGIDSCQGDSGGPLFIDFNGKPHVAGIVSWGFGCADPFLPGVYTRVSVLEDWVINKISPNGASAYQVTNYAAQANWPFEVTFETGNTSSTDKDVQLLLHAGNFSEIIACNFTVPANAPTGTYTLRGKTSMEWNTIGLSIALLSPNNAPWLVVDDVNVQYKPSLSVSGTECMHEASPDFNLLRNGDFSSAESYWSFWGNILHAAPNSELEFFGTSGGGSVYQLTQASTPSNTPFELTFDLENASSASKDIQVLIHATDWTEVLACNLTIPANTPPGTFTMRGKSSIPWGKVGLSLSLLTGDGIGLLRMDNVDLQYKPGVSVSGTECIQDTPSDSNLLMNGDFSSGENFWNFWGEILHAAPSGELEFFRPTVSPNGASIYQITNYAAASGAPLELTFDLENASGVTKELQILVHSSDWTDLFGCNLTIPGNTSATTFTMRGKTNAPWSKVGLSISLVTADSIGLLRLDNVDLQYKPSLSVTGTECQQDAVADQNVLTNGDFSAGETAWNFWGNIVHGVLADALEFHATGAGASVYQITNYAALANAPFEVTFDMENTSGSTKDIQVILHASDWTDWLVCAFTIPASAPSGTYTMRGQTSVAWNKIGLSISVLSADSLPKLVMDNASVQYKPSLTVGGTECLLPALPNQNVLTNGDFSAGEAAWSFWGSVVHGAPSGVLEFYATGAGASVYQITNHSALANAPFEVSLDLANTSAGAKTIQVLLHANTWVELLGCQFVIPTSASSGTYTLRGETTQAWDRISLTIAIVTADSLPDLKMDNVSVQYNPSLSVSGTECESPSPAPPVLTAGNEGLRIEAEDTESVTQSGEWVHNESDAASANAYVFSGGNVDDTLSFTFEGTAITIVYVQHPGLGSFDVVVDGKVVETVTLTGVENFGERAAIEGLSDGEHTVTIVPNEGVIALDAFLLTSK